MLAYVVWLVAPDPGDTQLYGIYRTDRQGQRAVDKILAHPDFHIQDGWGIIAREMPLAKVGGRP